LVAVKDVMMAMKWDLGKDVLKEEHLVEMMG
jgi:hypothetical protein